MGIFRLGHKHVSPETLTEYLDGRLRSQARERLEGVISGCADCRQELDGLRDTIAMLRQLPVAAPRRSFVMAAPPAEAPEAQSMFSFRPPQWAYAGAASMAALALAVLVTVDASGLVAPDLPDTVILSRSDNGLTPADLEVLRREVAGAKDGAQRDTSPPQAAAESIHAERETAVEAPAAAMAAEAPAVAVMEPQAALAAEIQAETTAEKSLKAPVAQLQAAEEPAVRSAQADRAAQPTMTESAPGRSELTSAAQPETVEISPLPTAVSNEAMPESTQAQEATVAFEHLRDLATPGTPLAWRLLEVAVAALFLVLAVFFFLSRRASRRF